MTNNNTEQSDEENARQALKELRDWCKKWNSKISTKSITINEKLYRQHVYEDYFDNRSYFVYVGNSYSRVYFEF